MSLPHPVPAPDAAAPEGRLSTHPRELVIAAAAILIGIQAGIRAWALYPGWFLLDDYRLIDDARGGPFTLERLLAPYDSQFMPVGRAIAWVVSREDANWGMAATSVFVMQVLAGIACAWMLFTLFGVRPWALAPLALYLFTALNVPAMMWWAAALNQVPLQLVFFVSVGAWVRYARSRHLGWLAVTMLALGFGLLCYVKTALVFVVLAYLLLAYFSHGSPLQRVWHAVRRAWPALIAAVALGGIYAYHYVTEVPSIFVGEKRPPAGDLAEAMLGRSLVTGLLGGPWRWNDITLPTVQIDPPLWATSAAWVVLIGFAVGAALFRRRTGRAWGLLSIYAILAFGLVVTSRAPLVGAIIGLELRYLTDLAPLAALCLGLVTLPLLGATESSERRATPLLTVTPDPRILVAAVAVVAASGIWSGVTYARVWHSDHPSAEYMHNAMTDLRNLGGVVDLLDQTVPRHVDPGFTPPSNTTRVLLPLLVDNARFPLASDNLHLLDEQGNVHPARVEGVSSKPGPAAGCGWRVSSSQTTIPLERAAFDYRWWISISYLAPQSGTLEVRAGGSTREVPVHRGLGTAFVRVDGEVDEVVLQMQDDATTLCVDMVAVGEVKARGTS
ncbi:hypothetical protein [Nocardioides panzhihuensis]|uniref:Glycosyltransferase RgtA/B/C/D-like domain-containing protein n=1 Tax=Nocardioides panzhihuensis TaxID=860243 RepID=A0A7Z0IR87_9ACTN|nr:hypothetical protein [Nocardioides panzhihuensis]NYI76596.1 hypothetical protein [Nocardioides panzhihuensis]